MYGYRSVLLATVIAGAMCSTALAQSSSGATSSSNPTAYSGASIVNNAPARVRSTIDSTANAFAPGLTSAGINSCAGSASVGVGGTGFSFGGGSTYELDECTRRANAAALAALGLNAAALEMLCESDSMRKAINRSGALCPSQQAEYIAAQQRANETGTPVALNAPDGNQLLAPSPAPVRRREARVQRRVATKLAVEAGAANTR